MTVQRRFSRDPRNVPDRVSMGAGVVSERLVNERDSNDTLDQYMPDASGRLLVLASCEKHFTRQPQPEMRAGIVAPCINPRCLG